MIAPQFTSANHISLTSLANGHLLKCAINKEVFKNIKKIATRTATGVRIQTESKTKENHITSDILAHG
jgi:hypothetical protein